MKKIKLNIDDVSTYGLWYSKIRCDNEEEEARLFEVLEKHNITWVDGSALKSFDIHRGGKVPFPIGFIISNGYLSVLSFTFDEEEFDKISLPELTAKNSDETLYIPKREWDITRATLLLRDCLRVLESGNFPPCALWDELHNLVKYYNE